MSTVIPSPATGLRDQQEAEAIAAEAYLYLYPLVMMDTTRRQMTNAEPGGQPGFGPMNAFSHMRAFPAVEWKAVPWGNFDTLYSLAWLDVTHEPMVLSVPDTGGRYYLMPIQDMWTDVFAVPGKRASGTEAGHFAVVSAGWHGELPAGVRRIDAPTPYVWIMGRTQTNGPGDYAAVNPVQDGYAITPLSQWGGESQPAPVVVDPTIDMTTTPVEQVNRMTAAAFFERAAELLKLHPPHVTDWSVLTRMHRLGITPGQSLHVDTLDPLVRQALESGAGAARQAMQAKVPKLAPTINGWQVPVETMGVYGNYLKRATLAMVGLGSNPPEDAVYPLAFVDADGQPLSGDRAYVLHFERQELPPANAFWSVTLYQQDGFQAPNALNRYALGDRDALSYNADGSLDLVIQHESPGAEHEANWLPAPAGPMAVFLRLYEPRPEVLDGRWAPPAVRRAT